MFPVIQLLGSLEAGANYDDDRLVKISVSSNSASRKLGRPLLLYFRVATTPLRFPVIQLLGSLEEHRSETRTLTGV